MAQDAVSAAEEGDAVGRRVLRARARQLRARRHAESGAHDRHVQHERTQLPAPLRRPLLQLTLSHQSESEPLSPAVA